MTEATKDSHSFNALEEKESKSADRAWVKPTIEKLSLKQALSTKNAFAGDTTTSGS